MSSDTPVVVMKPTEHGDCVDAAIRLEWTRNRLLVPEGLVRTPGAPLTAITSWPIVWLPAFLMPVAVFLHVVSLRQNLRRLRAASGVQHT